MNSNITDDDIILYHLTRKYEYGSMIHRSSFVALLGDARSASGRDSESGQKMNKPHGNWLALLGYLILLDQIGDTFTIKGRISAEKKAIYRALDLFSKLDVRQRNSIVSDSPLRRRWVRGG